MEEQEWTKKRTLAMLERPAEQGTDLQDATGHAPAFHQEPGRPASVPGGLKGT